MKFRRSARLEAGLQQLDIVPLIDCIFLLLIFFMLTSSSIIVPGINVKLPKVLTSEEVDSRALTITISGEDIIYLQDQPYTIDEIEDFIKKGTYKSIFIRADRDASLGTAVSIWDICKRMGIDKIAIATTEE